MPFLCQRKKRRQDFAAVLVVTASLTFPSHTVGQERVDLMATTVGQWLAMLEQARFGNLETSFVEADLQAIGIASGDSFQMRCHERSFNVLFGRGFRDVPVGDWVAFRSPQGSLTIARNSANAAEGSGCIAGDGLFVSQRR